MCLQVWMPHCTQVCLYQTVNLCLRNTSLHTHKQVTEQPFFLIDVRICCTVCTSFGFLALAAAYMLISFVCQFNDTAGLQTNCATETKFDRVGLVTQCRMRIKVKDRNATLCMLGIKQKEAFVGIASNKRKDLRGSFSHARRSSGFSSGFSGF